MKRYKSLFKENIVTNEMTNFFNTRTRKHINLVRKYLDRIIKLNFSEVDNRILEYEKRTHDASKFRDPEYKDYIYITWDYHLKDKGETFDLPDEIRNNMNRASEHHVKNNSHHPEYWSGKVVDLINREDRDKPPQEIINVTKMPFSYLACMVADWCAMSEEKGTNSPIEWASKNINIRWKFTYEQTKFIYKVIDRCWK